MDLEGKPMPYLCSTGFLKLSDLLQTLVILNLSAKQQTILANIQNKNMAGKNTGRTLLTTL
jgi:hypothetical protein